MAPFYVQAGDTVELRREVTEHAVTAFADISGDHSPNHVDEEAMSHSAYKGRIAHGALLVAYMSACSTALVEAIPHVRATETPVSLGYDRIRFLKPVFIGDQLRLRYVVRDVDRRPASRAFGDPRDQSEGRAGLRGRTHPQVGGAVSAAVMTKLMSAEAAAALVPDGATVLVDGSGGGVNEPGLVLAALESRFAREQHPARLTVVHPSGVGDGQGAGIDRFAHPGMVSKAIGGHWNWAPRMQRMALAEEIEAYCLPQGVLSHLFRAIAGHAPGVITHIGLGTFVDPRIDGGRLNARPRMRWSS